MANTNNYPDWVLKYKSKGVYVIKKKDSYYLYRAHSQRIKGTNKVKRIFDGYIGRVTEEDGFIPVRDKIVGDILVFDFGMPAFLFALCMDIYKGFKKSHRTYADTIFVLAIAQTLHIEFDDIPSSALPLLFKNYSIKQCTKEEVTFQCSRCVSMIESYLKSKVDNDDLRLIYRLFPQVHLTFINDSYRLSSFGDDTIALLNKYHVEVTKYAKSI